MAQTNIFQAHTTQSPVREFSPLTTTGPANNPKTEAQPARNPFQNKFIISAMSKLTMFLFTKMLFAIDIYILTFNSFKKRRLWQC